MRSDVNNRPRKTIRRPAIGAFVALIALIGFVGVSAAKPSMTLATSFGGGSMEWLWAPLIGEEFCSTDGATLMTAGIDASWFLFFGGLLAAIAIAALFEIFPLIGWLNSVAFMMMGKIPVAIFFVGFIVSVITLATGATGISPPPCLPIIG